MKKFPNIELAKAFLLSEMNLSLDQVEKLAPDYVENSAPLPTEKIEIPNNNLANIEQLTQALGLVLAGRKSMTTEEKLREYEFLQGELAKKRADEKEVQVRRQFEARCDEIGQVFKPDYKNFAKDLNEIAFDGMILQGMYFKESGFIAQNGTIHPTRQFGDIPYVQRALNVRNQQEFDVLLNKAFPIQTRAAMRPGTTGAGAEFVQTMVASTVIELIFIEEEWLKRLIRISMPTPSYKIGKITAGMSWYLGGSGAGTIGDIGGGDTAVKAKESILATSDVTFTAKKLIGRIAYDDDAVEDVIVPLLPLIRKNVIESLATVMARNICFGDIRTDTNNINYYGGTPNTTPGEADYWLAWDGLVKTCLESSNYYVSAGHTLALADLEGMIGKSAFKKYWARRTNGRVIWLLNPSTEAKLIPLARAVQVVTGLSPVILEAGVLSRMYGADVFITDGLPDTHTDGKVSSTAANNTNVNALLLYLPNILIGERKELSFETFRVMSLQNFLVTNLRIDCQQAYGGGASIYLYNAQ